MTMRDEGELSAAFAGAPDAYWPDDGSDCRWCRILLGPVSVAVSASAEGARGWRAGPRAGGTRAWLERVRPVMLPLAALTVLAALVLVAGG